MGDDSFVPENPNMLYDLRQTYAIKILTPILLLLEEYKDTDNFPKWYEKLTIALYTNVHQKLTPEEREEYIKQRTLCLQIINRHSNVYSGRDKSPREVFIVKSALLELEMWLKDKMEVHGLYGKGIEYDWDEI